MFSWKKSEKATKNSVVVSVHRKVFYSCEDIVCTCDTHDRPRWSLQHRNLLMESFWCLRWLHVSTIHGIWRGLKSLNLRDTLTLLGATPFDDCLLTLLAHHMLNLFEIHFFADWLMLISKGWNLFVRLCRMISNDSYS